MIIIRLRSQTELKYNMKIEKVVQRRIFLGSPRIRVNVLEGFLWIMYDYVSFTLSVK